MQITAELEHYHDVCMCIYIYVYMVKWSFTSSPYNIHLYIHWIYDLGRVLRLILSLLYYFYTITLIHTQKKKENI